MGLDTRDARLLGLLQQDSRLPNAELSERVGMSASACWRRIRQFETEGVITGYGARVDPSKMRLDFQAIVHVQLTRHDPDKLEAFISAVKLRAEVQECYAVTGQADYHLRVLCRDLMAYNRFLETFLFRLPAVESAQTNVILRALKTHGTILP